MANIKLTLPAAPFSGQIVTFTAVCGCDEVTDGLIINDETYTVCDAMGECVTGKGGAWCAGAQVSVVLDCENKKAFIQNAAAPNLTEALNAHIDNQNNPHNVTADQVAVTENVVNAIRETGNWSVDGILTQLGSALFGGDVLYQWQKVKNEFTMTFRDGSLFGGSTTQTMATSETLYYSADIEIDYTNKQVVLVNPQTITIEATENNTLTASDLGIEGCYFRQSASPSSSIYKATADTYVKAKYTDSSNSVYVYTAEIWKITTSSALVTSTDPNAYVDGYVDAEGYTYTALEPIMAFVPRIQTGSYVGTGTSGVNNPCKLTFSFVPKFVVIIGADYYVLFVPSNLSNTFSQYGYVLGGSLTTSQYAAAENQDLRWYGANAKNQMNTSGQKYSWFSIG